jgi:hypothetical protein
MLEKLEETLALTPSLSPGERGSTSSTKWRRDGVRTADDFSLSPGERDQG